MCPFVGFDLVRSYWSGIRWSIPWCGRSWLKYDNVYSVVTRSKCLSSWIRIWSRHSLRIVPMNLSQIPFAWGVRYGVFNSLMPAATAEKCVAYFLSRSRIRYFGPFPTALLPVAAAPSMHRLGILSLPYALSAAFSAPAPQIHTIAEIASHLLP